MLHLSILYTFLKLEKLFENISTTFTISLKTIVIYDFSSFYHIGFI